MKAYFLQWWKTSLVYETNKRRMLEWLREYARYDEEHRYIAVEIPDKVEVGE